jgi:hypothetical protein
MYQGRLALGYPDPARLEGVWLKELLLARHPQALNAAEAT